MKLCTQIRGLEFIGALPLTVAAAREGPVGTAYNFCVARGWESKSVELQQDDASSSSTGERKRHLTPAQREIESLQSAENPRYRKILEHALAELDEQITRLV
jgi:hypothetical protein